MSTYTEWTPLSKTYDQYRPPIGVHLYLGLAYTATGKTADKIQLLDAGCGTGTHVEYLLNHGLTQVAMFDANEGMLQKAKDRLKAFIDSGNVKIQQNLLPEMPYADDSFDVVMVNQVMHHLVGENDTELTVVRKTLKEAYRVLRKPGILIATHPTEFQLMNGYWYAKILPQAFEKLRLRLTSSEKWLEMFSEAGFGRQSALVEPLELAAREEYFNAEGPLEDGWFNANSAVASTKPDERLVAREKIRKLKAEGKLEQFYQEADSLREHVGQYTIFYAVKS